MIKGTHNTMSYLPVSQWWLRPFRAWGRCQTKSLTEQWDAGVRYFDFRIKFTNDGEAYFGHGALTYRCNSTPKDIICELCRKAERKQETIYLRIMLEARATEENQEQFRNWLTTIVGTLNATDANYIIGQKIPFLYYHRQDMGILLCEVAKHYNVRWHFLLPPKCWLWEQQRIKEAVAKTEFDGIMAEDFV